LPDLLYEEKGVRLGDQGQKILEIFPEFLILGILLEGETGNQGRSLFVSIDR
jgi:hypothetical protein